MIQKKYVNINADSVNDALYEHLFTAMCDICNTVKLNNNPVIRLDNYLIKRVNNNFQNETFFRFVNDFESFNDGLIIWGGVPDLALCKINDADNISKYYTDAYVTPIFPSNDSNYSTCINPVTNTTSLTPAKISNIPYYMYTGTDVAYFAFGHTSRCCILAKMKSIDDPTVFKYMIILHGYDGSGSSYNYVFGNYKGIYIYNSESLACEKITSRINYTGVDINNIIVEKFIYDGYYTDDLFLFNENCPSGIFTVDGTTYLNIAYNLYMKIV